MKTFLSVILFLFFCCTANGQTGRTMNADGASDVKVFNVRDYGAVGDGTTMDSPAIQKAIDDCSKAGGGTVVIPPGKYLSGTIQLRDNVRLYLDKNALLLGTTDINAYKNLDPFTEEQGIDVGWAFIIAIDVKNVSIVGEGVIDGQGAALKARHIEEDKRPEAQIWGRRPFLLCVLRCDNVKVSGVTLKSAGAWTSHYALSKNIEIENVKIISYGVAHNDGINIDGCQHVLMLFTGVFENVNIRNLKAKIAPETQLTQASGILITGIPGHYINNLTLDNIEIELPGGGTVAEGPYVPAYGVWARHVKNLNLNNVSFKLNNPDFRPAIICQDGENVLITGFRTSAFEGSEAVVRMDSVRNAYFTSANIRGTSNALLQLTGKYNEDIHIDGKQTTNISRMVDAVNGADEAVVEQRPLPDAANSAVAGASLSYTPGETPDSWAIATAKSTMARWPDYTRAYNNPWTYVNGYMACAFERLYQATGDTTYMVYIKRYIDSIIDENGDFRPMTNSKGITRIPYYCDNLDGMMTGNTIVMMYEHYKDERYRKAADKMRHCLNNYPRNSDGGFWHNKGSHGQMWIDGIFMGQMFLLRYGKSIGDSQYAFDEAALQITAYSKRGERDKTGLYIHGVYEPGHGSYECRWADPVTGLSPEVWGEGLGWYALVLVEALETIPESHPKYNELKNIFVRLAAGLKNTQDPVSGGWYQVVDKTSNPDNWLETSGSTMFVYMIQQGINLGFISKKDYGEVVEKGYKFICNNAKINRHGLVDIYNACDGLSVQDSYSKYINHKQSLNAKEAVVGFVWATEIVERQNKSTVGN